MHDESHHVSSRAEGMDSEDNRGKKIILSKVSSSFDEAMHVAVEAKGFIHMEGKISPYSTSDPIFDSNSRDSRVSRVKDTLENP